MQSSTHCALYLVLHDLVACTLSQAKDKVLVGRAEAEQLKVTMEDFDHALQYDLKPAFGISDEQLDRYVFNGVCCMSIIT